MIYDNTVLQLVKQITIEPGIHKRELSKKLNLSMPSITNGLNKLKPIIKEIKKGNQLNYYLDYSKKELTPLLTSSEFYRLKELPSNIQIAINELFKKLSQKPILAIIFGSYANKTYTKKSDLDLLLVFNKIINNKKLEQTAEIISMNTGVQINLVYLKYNEFRKSFGNLRKTFFKNLKQSNIILTGVEWWRLLKDEEA